MRDPVALRRCATTSAYPTLRSALRSSGYPSARISRTSSIHPRSSISVARAAMVCVYARSVAVDCANRSIDGNNRSIVTVADGFDPTRNQYEVLGQGFVVGHGPTFDVPIPPFANRARAEVASPVAASTAYLDLFDGSGQLRSRTFLPDQPDDGIALGGAGKLQLTPGANWRVVFHLNL